MYDINGRKDNNISVPVGEIETQFYSDIKALLISTTILINATLTSSK